MSAGMAFTAVAGMLFVMVSATAYGIIKSMWTGA